MMSGENNKSDERFRDQFETLIDAIAILSAVFANPELLPASCAAESKTITITKANKLEDKIASFNAELIIFQQSSTILLLFLISMFIFYSSLRDFVAY